MRDKAKERANLRHKAQTGNKLSHSPLAQPPPAKVHVSENNSRENDQRRALRK
jgi:hypothetical protein